MPANGHADRLNHAHSAVHRRLPHTLQAVCQASTQWQQLYSLHSGCTVAASLLAHTCTHTERHTHTRVCALQVLEPRRVAAKAAARRMAALLGEPVGRTVGYRVRLEARVSAATRIEVVTEGILLRRLQQDPSLEGVGAILLDEFHERSLDADTSLALALDCQAWTRPDLR